MSLLVPLLDVPLLGSPWAGMCCAEHLRVFHPRGLILQGPELGRPAEEVSTSLGHLCHLQKVLSRSSGVQNVAGWDSGIKKGQGMLGRNMAEGQRAGLGLVP